MNKILSLFLILMLAGASKPERPARVDEVTLEVNGLVCSSCALGMEAGFKRLPFVSSVAYNEAGHSFTLSVKADKSTDLHQVLEMVRKNGFTHGKIWLKGAFRIMPPSKQGSDPKTHFLVAENLTQKLRLEALPNKEKGISAANTVIELEGRIEPPETPKRGSNNGAIQSAPQEEVWKFAIEDKPKPGESKPEKPAEKEVQKGHPEKA